MGILAGYGFIQVVCADIFLTVAFILIVPEPGATRSSRESNIATIVTVFLMLVFTVAANEMRLFENKKRDVKSLFRDSHDHWRRGDIGEERPSLSDQLWEMSPLFAFDTLTSLTSFGGALSFYLAKDRVERMLKSMWELYRTVARNPQAQRPNLGRAWASEDVAMMVAAIIQTITAIRGSAIEIILGGIFGLMASRTILDAHLAAISVQFLDENAFPRLANQDPPDLDAARAGKVCYKNITEVCRAMICLLSLGLNGFQLLSALALAITGLSHTRMADRFPRVASFEVLVALWHFESGRSIDGSVGLISVALTTAVEAGFIRSAVRLRKQHFWKEKLNAMSAQRFEEYRSLGVDETKKGYFVSRGGIKLDNMNMRGLADLHGEVVDLGCGRGGWNQYCATLERVASVKGYTKGGTGHEKPVLFDTRGYNLVTLKENVDAYALEPHKGDTILCDIGESDPDPGKEEKRSLRNVSLLEKWLQFNPKTSWVIKILNPTGMKIQTKLESMQRQWGGGGLVPQSRNTTHEMYYTNMATGNIPRSVNQLSHVLIARMKGDSNITYHREPPVLQKGTRHPSTFTPPDMDHPSVITRVKHVKNTFRNSWHIDAQNPYRTWKYFGSYAIKPLRGGAAVSMESSTMYLVYGQRNTQSTSTR